MPVVRSQYATRTSSPQIVLISPRFGGSCEHELFDLRHCTGVGEHAGRSDGMGVASENSPSSIAPSIGRRTVLLHWMPTVVAKSIATIFEREFRVRARLPTVPRCAVIGGSGSTLLESGQHDELREGSQGSRKCSARPPFVSLHDAQNELSARA